MIRQNFNKQFGQLVFRYFFILAPTSMIGLFTLRNINLSYTNLSTDITSQWLFFTVGLLCAYTLYFYRVRGLISFILLAICYYFIDNLISKLPGEFDVFYTYARFQLFSLLFIIGWLTGFLLLRVKYSYIFLSALVILISIVISSNTVDVSLNFLLVSLLPPIGYSLYMLFILPSINADSEWKKSGKLILKFCLFALLLILAFIFVANQFKNELKATEKELIARGMKEDNNGGESYDERYGLMEKKGKGMPDEGMRLKDTLKINSKMSESKQLVFCSKLENYFPDGSPAPLYFVYHHLTKYDPIQEAFTRDTEVPLFDEFDIDPTSLNLYQGKYDSSVINNSKGRELRKVVDLEVYLSSNAWRHAFLAPATAFYCQPIPIEKRFNTTFFSAYKAKSYTSQLNNAYFVYNPSANKELKNIQLQRHEELKKVKNYDNVDSAFYEYYTKLPNGILYDSIKKLAQSISRNLTLPVDKTLAVQNFFLKRGLDGKRIFKYTLKPGGITDPNIPNATMLANFLFRTHAGYCTYYAGAALFLLRSLGIPSRFTTGFATIDRGGKNKGWYWFYGNQAHAWTQVYFPNYGWMDFDMTIGNEGMEDAPRPDGTPPLPPPEAWLVIDGIANSEPNLKAKKLQVAFQKISVFGKEHSISQSVTREVDASFCRVLFNEKDTTLAAIQSGDSTLIVSYNDKAKKIPKLNGNSSIKQILSLLPNTVIADEIHIFRKTEEKKKDDVAVDNKQWKVTELNWTKIAFTTAIVLGCFILIVLFFPILFLLYRLIRVRFATDSEEMANHVYKAALYRFHMAGFERDSGTALDYAVKKIDPSLNTNFEQFMLVYLRLKYGSGKIEPNDKDIISIFSNSYGKRIGKSIGLFKLFLNYFNLMLASRFFFTNQENY